jgi:hypothetical protein
MTDELVLHNEHQSAFLAPVADVRTALMRYQAVKDFIGGVLREGTDYGKIPGAGDKPTLLKPGAEKMATFFGFTVRFDLTEKVEDWTGEQHGGEPFFYYRYRCSLWRGASLVAEGDGSCNSWEKKYRYRSSERVCPVCGKSTIIKGKQEYGGGFICFAKKGGCGAKFPDNAPEIVEQVVGQVKNPDPADTVNTLQKMAQKRALIAPILIATNTSDYFTQDVEDFIDGTFAPEQAHSKPAPAPMTYEQAAARLTPGNKRYDTLTIEQLNVIVSGEKSSAESREAARVVLENDFSSSMPDPRTGDGENHG